MFENENVLKFLKITKKNLYIFDTRGGGQGGRGGVHNSFNRIEPSFSRKILRDVGLVRVRVH